MASMFAGELVEAYVLKNACREKMKTAQADAVGDGAEAKKAGSGNGAAEAEQKEPDTSKGKGRGFFGLLKKVHPKADRGVTSSWRSFTIP